MTFSAALKKRSPQTDAEFDRRERELADGKKEKHDLGSEIEGASRVHQLAKYSEGNPALLDLLAVINSCGYEFDNELVSDPF
jgi:hypothetical protein